MRLWATHRWHSCTWKKESNQMIFKVHFNPSHSMILWYPVFQKIYAFIYLFIYPQNQRSDHNTFTTKFSDSSSQADSFFSCPFVLIQVSHFSIFKVKKSDIASISSSHQDIQTQIQESSEDCLYMSKEEKLAFYFLSLKTFASVINMIQPREITEHKLLIS